MVAVGWSGAPVGAVQLRARTSDTWGAWVELEADPDHAPDPTSPDASAARPTAVGPVWTGSGTQAVELRVTSGRLADLRVDVLRTEGSGAPSAEPTGAMPRLLAPRSTATVRTNSPVPTAMSSELRTEGSPALAATSTSPAMPAIQPRAAWGAGPWRCSGSPSEAPLRNAIVHHTASGNSYTQSEVDDVLRGIYYFHTETRGWCDIAYNFLVDRFGGMWEGRTGSLSGPVIGGHASGFNTGSVGLSVIGNYDGVTLPSATFTGLRRVLGWRFGAAGIDPEGQVTVKSGGSTKYPAGTMVTLPTIAGHRDVSLTACPGTGIYNRLGELRTLVGDDLTTATAPGPPGTPSAVPGNARATVSWSAPASDGGSPTTGYVVRPYIGTTAQAPVTFNSTARSRVVTGLANSATYTFRVSAINAVGTGPPSAASNAVTPTATFCLGRPTTAVYGDGNDTIFGTAGDDVIFAGGGDDIVNGGGGNDRICGGGGNDTLDGGDGDDFLVGGAGNDIIRGGTGIDRVLYNDRTGWTQGVRVTLDNIATDGPYGVGEADNVGTSVENITGGAGNDELRAQTGSPTVNSLSGGAGADKLYGYDGADTLFGDGGNDTLYGGGGNDTLDGGDGNDSLVGGTGNDIIRGGTGIDRVLYNDRTGWTQGVRVTLDNIANDGQYGIGEADNVGTSVENITGGAGNDELRAQTGTPTVNSLSGGAGDDKLYGYDGADTLSGDGGADSLYGGGGNDTLLAKDSLRDIIVDCGGHTSGTTGDLALVDAVDPRVGCERLG
ncbi:fibronectin type III domain-containing protein [Iamia sp.]|uniref:fibronectin type III domain-containing protein n=1 Tax=Iamia sp. TaxID=2722710 RepID=UPI002C239B86|nr:N-acetylmuramoyl-L-alanine amidase [Iamia sp.]HXH56164.1 N-acetylmuramoyl-L-alanine amidase [Iamia sp.]